VTETTPNSSARATAPAWTPGSGQRPPPHFVRRANAMGARAAVALGALALASANYVTLSDRYTADPAPFVHDGRLYIYTSHDLADQRDWKMVDYSLMSTDDLSNWRDEGIVFDINDQTWGMYAWAQQVIDGPRGFYMYYVRRSAISFSLARRRSLTPLSSFSLQCTRAQTRRTRASASPSRRLSRAPSMTCSANPSTTGATTRPSFATTTEKSTCASTTAGRSARR